MTSLYNCKHSGDQYRISKFDSDWNLEASYLCNLSACECPAGHRPKCRHREMLPKFIQRNAVGTEWFYDHDRGGWVQGWKEEPALSLEEQAAQQFERDHLEGEALPIQQEVEPSPINHIYAEEDCPGHIASDSNPKICKWCGIHSDSLRPDDDYIHEAEFSIDSLAPTGLGQASWQTPSPLHFDKDYSDSIGHSPGHDALGPSPTPTIRRRV